MIFYYIFFLTNEKQEQAYLSITWAIVAISGNGPPAPQSGSLVVSINGCQKGGMGPRGYGASSTYTMENDMEKILE